MKRDEQIADLKSQIAAQTAKLDDMVERGRSQVYSNDVQSNGWGAVIEAEQKLKQLQNELSKLESSN